MERLADAYTPEKTEQRGVISRFSLKGYTFDLFVIATVAVLLFLVTKTRPAFQNQLVLFYDDPSLHAFYTTHFVHNSPAHLHNNLTSYLVVVPLTYLISLRAGRYCEFRLGFLAVLFVLPPILSLVSYLGLDLVIQTIFGFNPDVQSSRGFSALAGAFVGMLTVAVADLFRQLADQEASLWPVIGLMVTYGAAVAFWGVFEYLVSPLTVLLVLLPIAYAVWLVRKIEMQYEVVDGIRAGGCLRGKPLTLGLLVVGFFVAVWGTQGLLAFPWFEGGTNTLSHLIGVTGGIGLNHGIHRSIRK